jgi:hypothetical protein
LITPADRRSRLLAALYAKFGEPADWTPVGGGGTTRVTVRPAPEDDVLNFGDGRALVEKIPLLVRVAEVATPAANDVFVLNPGPGEEAVQLLATPRRTRYRLEWLLEARRL